MSQKQQPYCRLEIFSCFVANNPLLENEILIENYDSFSTLKQRLIELSVQWKNDLPKFIERGWYAADCQNSYITFILRNRWDDSVQIGITDRGWLLHEFPPENAFTFYENQIDEVVLILFPEWTEVRLQELRPEQEADNIISKWLDTGEVELVNPVGRIIKEF